LKREQEAKMLPKSSLHEKTRSTKKVQQKFLAVGTILVILIIISPYLFTLYESFPNIKIWETPFGTYRSHYYESVSTLAWTLTGKLVPLYLLTIWFFTCKHWWYHAILVPIAMYIVQIMETIDGDRYVDTLNIYIMAPIVLIAAVFLYTIRTKIFDKIHGIDLSELGRVSWKGDLAPDTKEDSIIIEGLDDDDLEDDDDPLYMG